MNYRGTKPEGPRTGNSTNGCYAGELADCEGGLNREHWLTKKLLIEKGPSPTSGLSWFEGAPVLGHKNFRAHVLCYRHNGALSGLDHDIGEFYKLLQAVREGRNIGVHQMHGDVLELWPWKVFAGGRAAGAMKNVETGLTVPKSVVHRPLLELLFGDARLAPPQGLYFFEPAPDFNETAENRLNIAFNFEPVSFAMAFDISADVDPFDYMTRATHDAEQDPRRFYGVTVQMLGFNYTSSLVDLRQKIRSEVLNYRPAAFELESGGGSN